ncbi:MAG TPA: CoA transferase [Bacteroidia bacterium]|jgi:crotonobetainyl-CoA:carnitine CoA-transferase CaiB-like acyl-CoA transferase
MNKPFNDLKVIELANVLAGPAVGLFFAELGAEVIKIENKTLKGDVTRSWKLPSEDQGSAISAYFSSVNWNKKSLFLDLSDSSAKENVYALVKDADIVITNYKSGDAEKLGMNYELLKKINPGIIYAHISGFGEDSSRTAFDIVLQAETGFMFMNGTQESGPVKMPVALIDILAAHQLKEGILIALLQKMKTGKGAKVSVSLYDAAIASLANQATNWLMAGHDPQPCGSLHPNIAPYGELFTTRDKKLIVLAVGNDKQFKNLCTVLQANELLVDNRFSSNTLRVKSRTALFDHLQLLINEKDSSELMKHFIENDVPAGLVKSVREVLNEKAAQQLVLKQVEENGMESQRIKTAVFHIKH